MIKKYLLTPGPSPVPAEVLSETSKPIIHHRTSEFSKLFEEILVNLKYVFQTKNEVLVLAASGTGAMEASVVNLLSPNDKILVLDTGVFGGRWAKIAEAYGVTPIVIKEEWGNSVSLAKVKEALDKEKDIKVIFATHTETSTGVVNDIKGIADLIKNTNTVLVVDAISGLVGQELRTDEWGIDVVVSGSQKGFMLPPGLAFVALNEKAWNLVENSKLPKFYWSFKKARESQKELQTAFTPAISLIAGLKEALSMIKAEGIEKVWDRHKKMAASVRAGMKALGLEFFAKNMCDVVTSVKVPDGVEGGKIVKILREKYGVSIAGGQQNLKGKIIRLAHMGYMERFDMIIGISAVEMILKELGYNVTLGKGVAAVEEEILKWK